VLPRKSAVILSEHPAHPKDTRSTDLRFGVLGQCFSSLYMGVVSCFGCGNVLHGYSLEVWSNNFQKGIDGIFVMGRMRTFLAVPGFSAA